MNPKKKASMLFVGCMVWVFVHEMFADCRLRIWIYCLMYQSDYILTTIYPFQMQAMTLLPCAVLSLLLRRLKQTNIEDMAKCRRAARLNGPKTASD